MVRDAVGWSGEIVWDASKPDGTPRKLLDVSKLTGAAGRGEGAWGPGRGMGRRAGPEVGGGGGRRREGQRRQARAQRSRAPARAAGSPPAPSFESLTPPSPSASLCAPLAPHSARLEGADAAGQGREGDSGVVHRKPGEAGPALVSGSLPAPDPPRTPRPPRRSAEGEPLSQGQRRAGRRATRPGRQPRAPLPRLLTSSPLNRRPSPLCRPVRRSQQRGCRLASAAHPPRAPAPARTAWRSAAVNKSTACCATAPSDAPAVAAAARGGLCHAHRHEEPPGGCSGSGQRGLVCAHVGRHARRWRRRRRRQTRGRRLAAACRHRAPHFVLRGRPTPHTARPLPSTTNARARSRRREASNAHRQPAAPATTPARVRGIRRLIWCSSCHSNLPIGASGPGCSR
jgi:hypothetical protein